MGLAVEDRFVLRLCRVIAPAVAALIAAALLPAAAAANDAQAAGLHFRGAPHSNSTSSNLINRGGPVITSSHTYAIFWGPQSAWSSDTQSGLASLFGGFGGSNYLGIAAQYMPGGSINSAWQVARTDTSAPPRRVSANTLGTEVQKEFPSIDSNGIYFVYTSNFPNGGGFCAWHSFATVNGKSVPVAYMPNTNGVAGCDPGNLYGVSGSEQLRSLANVTAHEFMESITDPLPAQATYAWIDQSGLEIGDKCAWQFAGSVTLSNHSVWQLQQEWSNDANGAGNIGACAQGS